jgi:hypothetical protein
LTGVPGERHHIRNVLLTLAATVVAVVLAFLQVPFADAGPAATPAPSDAAAPGHLRTSVAPPRLVPEAPTAEAITAAPAPRPTTSTTTAPTTTSTPPTTAAPLPRPERIRALVDFPFEQVAPSWQISFRSGGPAGLLGFADQDARVIEVYVQPDVSDAVLAFTLAHEMAHALDTLHVTPDERAEYRALRGIPQEVDWLWAWNGGSAGDFVMPAGDFAESFAVATTGETSEWASRLGPPPSPEVQQQVVAMAQDV